MTDPILHQIIFTGGPGSGKTTLINALKKAGYNTMTESGRAIIQQQMTINGNGLPWVDPSLYAELMLSKEIEHYISHHITQSKTQYLFYDRAIPDIAGYLMTIGQTIPHHLNNAILQYRYHPQVFICPPWQEIYCQDKERKQNFDEAIKTFNAMQKIYAKAGYTVVEVPKTTIDQRLDFVLMTLSSH